MIYLFMFISIIFIKTPKAAHLSEITRDPSRILENMTVIRVSLDILSTSVRKHFLVYLSMPPNTYIGFPILPLLFFLLKNCDSSISTLIAFPSESTPPI
jgi:hypothetical protein